MYFIQIAQQKIYKPLNIVQTTQKDIEKQLHQARKVQEQQYKP